MSHGPRPGDYAARSRGILADHPAMRDSVTAATRTFDGNRRAAWSQIDAETWRDWMRDVKSHVLTHLDRYLEQAEASLTANGVHVHWAETADDVHAALAAVVDAHGVRRAVKAKSMLSEELGVNAYLERRGVHVRETDLGEYIIQLLGEPPSHIVGPAIHRSVDDCRALFHEELGTALDASPEVLAAAARASLRQDFLSADLGISGANFLAADTGTIALIENEGNIRLSTSVPPVHVALVGIEKLVPRLEDLAGFLQLTPRAATGQPIGNYVSLLQGPRRAGEPDGPDEVHVIFVDNGRTRVLADERAWEALRCVRCGACLNICPVYRQTGGHAYGWAYSGPIGAVLAPGLLGLEEAMPLPYASSLCGACADVCPVRIPLPDLLVYWRERAVEAGLVAGTERLAMRGYAAVADRPGVYRAALSALRLRALGARRSRAPRARRMDGGAGRPEPLSEDIPGAVEGGHRVSDARDRILGRVRTRPGGPRPRGASRGLPGRPSGRCPRRGPARGLPDRPGGGRRRSRGPPLHGGGPPLARPLRGRLRRCRRGRHRARRPDPRPAHRPAGGGRPGREPRPLRRGRDRLAGARRPRRTPDPAPSAHPPGLAACVRRARHAA